MPRAKSTTRPDSQEEDSALPDLGPVCSTFINGTGAPTMMAPLRRKLPPTIAIVLEAIKSLDDKKGSTYVAIKNWIMANYPEFNRSRLKLMITKALDKGVKESKIRRKLSEADDALTIGRYKIVEKKAAVKKEKPVKPAVEKQKTMKPSVDVPSGPYQDIKKELFPAKKQTKPSKKVVESRSDTEAEAKSPQVPVARRRRYVSESTYTATATAAAKVVKKPSKKNDALTKTVALKKSVAPKNTKATSSAKDTGVKKKATASKKKTEAKQN